MRIAKLRKRVARLHELQRAYQTEGVRPGHPLGGSVKGLLKKLRMSSGTSQRDIHFSLQEAKAELAAADKFSGSRLGGSISWVMSSLPANG